MLSKGCLKSNKQRGRKCLCSWKSLNRETGALLFLQRLFSLIKLNWKSIQWKIWHDSTGWNSLRKTLICSKVGWRRRGDTDTKLAPAHARCRVGKRSTTGRGCKFALQRHPQKKRTGDWDQVGGLHSGRSTYWAADGDSQRRTIILICQDQLVISLIVCVQAQAVR
jgi:hypothetical protein